MGRARRIAFVCPRFSEQGTIGGAETLLKALAERLVKAGREVHFLTTCATNHFTWANDVPPGTRTFNGLQVHFFPVNEDRDVGKFLTIQGSIDKGVRVSREDELAWITHSVNSRALVAHLEAEGAAYDRIVAGPYLFGVTWTVATRWPEKTLLVPCLHDEVFAYLGIMKDMFLGVRGFLFNTNPERDLAQRLYGIDPARTAVVGLGMDDFEADPKAFAARRGISARYVIYSGRREPLKGTPLLCAYLQAFRERTGIDLHAVFTGSGPIDASPELQPAIHDVGFVSEQEKREAMAGAVAFIHPSINESLGIVLLEAWLAGTPCLVHAKSAVLSDQCRRANGGLWFKNYPQFEEALLMLLEDEAKRKALAESGRRFVLEEYAWTAVEKRMTEALDAT
jgi:glycosyltransferase involved in cell wall biosynthesis